jgi:hypothetical protein
LLALVIHEGRNLDLVTVIVLCAGVVLRMNMVIRPACWFCR